MKKEIVGEDGEVIEVVELDPQPQALPEKIIEHPEAINIFKYVIYFIGGILAIIVIGAFILAFFDKTFPGFLEQVSVILATGIVGVLSVQAVRKES